MTRGTKGVQYDKRAIKSKIKGLTKSQFDFFLILSSIFLHKTPFELFSPPCMGVTIIYQESFKSARRKCEYRKNHSQTFFMFFIFCTLHKGYISSNILNNIILPFDTFKNNQFL